MISSIKEFVQKNYPEVKIVSAIEVGPVNPVEEPPMLKFYDVTFEYKGNKFCMLFHDRLNETVEEQFQYAINKKGIKIP